MGAGVWPLAAMGLRNPIDNHHGRLHQFHQAMLPAQAFDQPKHTEDHKERIPGCRFFVWEVVNVHDLGWDQLLHHLAAR